MSARFFTGLHQPSDASHFPAAFISVHRLLRRKSDFVCNDWILDSGAFSTIKMHGGYPHPVTEYAERIRRWAVCGNLLAAVAQDYMCEPMMLAKTGLSVQDHQRLTVERYVALLACDVGVRIIPVLQGQEPVDYLRHIEMYGDLLLPGMWVGVGSVCKRKDAISIERVLLAIRQARPDLLLHGFGVKFAALRSSLVNDLLFSADSMAWSFGARYGDGGQNDWREAEKWTAKLLSQPQQGSFGFV